MNAYELGAVAYNAGQALSTNPFNWADRSKAEHEHTSWNDGWINAMMNDRPADRLFKALQSTGVSMATCLAAEARL